MLADKGGLYMIAFNLNIAENLENEREEKFYPEWVKAERLYNCEYFGRIFSRRRFLLEKLFNMGPKYKGFYA